MEVDGDMIWRSLGLLSASICASGVAGVISWSAWMRHVVLFLEIPGAGSLRRKYELQAISLQWMIAFVFFYGVYIVWVIFALNLIVRRVSDHVSHSYYNKARDFDFRTKFDFRDCVGQYKMYYLVRSMSYVALFLAALHLAARVVQGSLLAESAASFVRAAASLNATDSATDETRSILETIDSRNTGPSSAVSKSLFAVTMVFMCTMYMLFSPACIVMFRRVERRLDAIIEEMNLRSGVGTVLLPFEFSPEAVCASSGKSRNADVPTQIELPVEEARGFLEKLSSAAAAQHRRFLLCLALVQVCLLLLASGSVFSALANRSLVSANHGCNRCGPCQPVLLLMSEWLDHAPEFLPILFSHCLTLPLTFSLWLMMSEQDRDMMLHPRRYHTDSTVPFKTVNEDINLDVRRERLRMGIDLQ